MTKKFSSPDTEILPPDESGADDQTAGNYYLAQVSNYTNRPDLLIAEIEQHDPGFVMRMNEASERDAAQLRAERFTFGKVQAYIGLGVSVIAAFAILSFMGIAVCNGQGFWTIIALELVYAITQGGTNGFRKLIDSIRQILPGAINKEDLDN